MSIPDVRLPSSASIPSPRTPEAASVAATRTPPAPRPWEPWGLADGVRPTTQYWDVGTASWRSGRPGALQAD